MNIFISDEQVRSGVMAAALLAVVWTVAAVAQPTSTYHLAPILVAGTVPIIARTTNGNLRRLLGTAAIGATVALVTTIGLASFDLLKGPTLLPYGGAFAEAITFTPVGAAAGILIGWIAPVGDPAAKLARS